MGVGVGMGWSVEGFRLGWGLELGVGSKRFRVWIVTGLRVGRAVLKVQVFGSRVQGFVIGV